MSQVDEGMLPRAEDQASPGATPWQAGGQEIGDNSKLVPVGESIRYRRRAQGAEKRVEELADELSESRAEATRLADELKATQREQELMRRLASEGTRDLEAAMLIAKSRLAKDEKAGSTGSPQGDIGSVVEQLKKEKKYLFVEKTSESVAVRTSPAKEQRNGATALERSAKRAAGTGSRSDLQEYMRKRRVLSF